MISINGSLGEGGGQVLRTALTCSIITGTRFEIVNIRANRPEPGLQPQHLTAIKAARAISKAETNGAEKNSCNLYFNPSGIFPSRYKWDIGTAGSTSLVLQTVHLPLSLCKVSSTVTLTGGTHVPWSPVFHFLEQHWLKYLTHAGFQTDLHLHTPGFYPLGSGKISATIRPITRINPLNIDQRGSIKRIIGISLVSNLDIQIAERQKRQVMQRLNKLEQLGILPAENKPIPRQVKIEIIQSKSKGTMVALLVIFEHSQAYFSSLGELRKPAERVADETVGELLAFLDTAAATDQFITDQLMLPLALASEMSTISTSKITQHLVTNIAVISQFLPVEFQIEGEIGYPGTIIVRPGIKS